MRFFGAALMSLMSKSPIEPHAAIGDGGGQPLPVDNQAWLKIPMLTARIREWAKALIQL